MSGSAPNHETAFSGPDLAPIVARGKRVDLAFGAIGLLLVIASLTVLLALFGQLARDGSRRMLATHEVKPDGFAPGMRELVGGLVRGPGKDSPWTLVRDPLLVIDPDKLLDRAAVETLLGQSVFVEGDLPQPGHLVIEVKSIRVRAADEAPRFSRDGVEGELARDERGWIVTPMPLELDLSTISDPQALEGKRVALDIGLKKQLPLQVREITELEAQGFFASMPSCEASRAGIKSAFVGSILVVFVAMFLAVPLGAAAGIFLEEYGRRNWITAIIEINIANLAGVPSIVWGLMALGLLVYQFGLGRSIQTAGLTLGLLVLPIVIMATREAVRAIPQHIREASYACGASRLQTIRHHVLPYSMGGILTGSIIGLSRAIGETAPLITIGALTYIAFLPSISWQKPLAWLGSGFTVVPIQMFNWVSRPDLSFQANAAAAGVILMALTLGMNAISIILRYRLRRRIQW